MFDDNLYSFVEMGLGGRFEMGIEELQRMFMHIFFESLSKVRPHLNKVARNIKPSCE